MARTLQQQLDAIDTQIENLETLLGESTGPMAEFVMGDGKRFKRAELDRLLTTLYTQRERLEQRIAAQGSTPFYLAQPFEQ